MVKFIGPLRIATWRHAFKQGTKGVAISWVGSRRLINLELHYERRGSE